MIYIGDNLWNDLNLEQALNKYINFLTTNMLNLIKGHYINLITI